jgi:hypothetical protein
MHDQPWQWECACGVEVPNASADGGGGWRQRSGGRKQWPWSRGWKRRRRQRRRRQLRGEDEAPYTGALRAADTPTSAAVCRWSHARSARRSRRDPPGCGARRPLPVSRATSPCGPAEQGPALRAAGGPVSRATSPRGPAERLRTFPRQGLPGLGCQRSCPAHFTPLRSARLRGAHERGCMGVPAGDSTLRVPS